MDSYDKDVQAYISDFRDIYNKLKNMGFIIEPWMLNDAFIDGLKGRYKPQSESTDSQKFPKNRKKKNGRQNGK
jgi:hypothetical protein